jgi:hypothetical protein
VTFLEIVQMMARESGTISGVQPSSVSGQTGRLGKFVYWANESWRRIQKMRSAWRWMRGDFTFNTSASTAAYTATAISLTRFSQWITEEQTITIYDPAIGVSDESDLRFLPWVEFQRRYRRGSHDATRPCEYSVSPANELCLGPTPDKAYTVRGNYRKSRQTLSANADVPECDEDFHEDIAWYGLILCHEHDEAIPKIATARDRWKAGLGALERDNLPTIGIGAGPIA